jgi:hypothetical protein
LAKIAGENAVKRDISGHIRTFGDMFHYLLHGNDDGAEFLPREVARLLVGSLVLDIFYRSAIIAAKAVIVKAAYAKAIL